MKSLILALAVFGSVPAQPATLACDGSFVLEKDGDQIAVYPASGHGFVRIAATAEQRMHEDPEWSAGLYSRFRTNPEQFAGPDFWLPGASLSIGAPDVGTTGHTAYENRIRFGDRRVLRDREIGWEHFGGRTPHSEPWTWSRSLGGASLDTFRETGSVRIEHWSGPSRRRLEVQTWARYDWNRIESLVQRARDHFAACAAADAAG